MPDRKLLFIYKIKTWRGIDLKWFTTKKKGNRVLNYNFPCNFITELLCAILSTCIQLLLLTKLSTVEMGQANNNNSLLKEDKLFSGAGGAISKPIHNTENKL